MGADPDTGTGSSIDDDPAIAQSGDDPVFVSYIEGHRPTAAFG